MDQFVLFGDSITRRTAVASDFVFFAALSDAYGGRLDVINRGFSGYDTTKALKVLPRVLPRPEQARIRLLTVCLGANDARHPGLQAGPEQHVPLTKFAENLRAIVKHPSIEAHDGIRIILVTPPPVDDRMCYNHRGAYLELGDRLLRSATTTAKYAQAVRDVGLNEGIVVLDLWSAMLKRAGYQGHDDETLPGDWIAPENAELQSMLLDGLHLTAKGYRVFFDELMHLIKNELQEHTPERIERLVPVWDDVPMWAKILDTDDDTAL